jgi:hypothetical protein
MPNYLARAAAAAHQYTDQAAVSAPSHAWPGSRAGITCGSGVRSRVARHGGDRQAVGRPAWADVACNGATPGSARYLSRGRRKLRQQPPAASSANRSQRSEEVPVAPSPPAARCRPAGPSQESAPGGRRHCSCPGRRGCADHNDAASRSGTAKIPHRFANTAPRRQAVREHTANRRQPHAACGGKRPTQRKSAPMQ